jgi:D-3-phosphoglycerate dehydrogenase / 2-oxoglutarate reductase
LTNDHLIWFLEPFDEEAIGHLKKVGEVKLGPRDRALTEKELSEIFSEASAILLTSRDKITRTVIESSNKLRILAKCGAKPSNIDLKAANERKIVVTYTPGSNPVSVAEHALTLMLALLKKMVPTMLGLRKGVWREERTKASELYQKTVGIVGLGQAGYQLAVFLKIFNCRVIYSDPYVSIQRASELGAERVEFQQLLAESDIVSLHCHSDESTFHLIDSPQLRRMKKSAFLINTGRGPLVNEGALVAALKEGVIAGAGIDVFEEEPVMQNNPLIALSNVVVTPHMAGWSHEALRREAVWAAEEVIRVLKGEKAINIVSA